MTMPIDTYLPELLAFCDRHGWKHTFTQFCYYRLNDPRHQCTSERCTRDGRLHHPLKDQGADLDHLVYLYRGPGNDSIRTATQYAILSQPYGDRDTYPKTQRLGPAPYGNGTIALLYEGNPIGSPTIQTLADHLATLFEATHEERYLTPAYWKANRSRIWEILNAKRAADKAENGAAWASNFS